MSNAICSSKLLGLIVGILLWPSGSENIALENIPRLGMAPGDPGGTSVSAARRAATGSLGILGPSSLSSRLTKRCCRPTSVLGKAGICCVSPGSSVSSRVKPSAST